MPLPNQLIHQLPYFEDSAELFAPISTRSWAVFLDSGFPYSQQGHFDIISADPVCTLVTRGSQTEISSKGETNRSSEDPFSLVKRKLQCQMPVFEGLPFNGGAIGYFSYDLARRLENLPDIAENAEHIPEMAVGIYEWAVIVDHHKRKSWLIGHEGIENWASLIDQFSQIRPVEPDQDFKVTGDVQTNMTGEIYADAFKRIKRYLTEGDCYQVNLAQRFSAPCTGNPWFAYRALREINSAPFCSYLNFPDVQVLSSSPERFLKVINGVVETKPIKGTRPRKQDQTENCEQIRELSNSGKDRAENVMIVDLLRNDISKTSQEGSVKVPKLFDVESFATVHHLVSTVTGILEEGKHALDLLRSCFPGGSITGAPKIRAMEIIEELEPNRRGVYCGSVGYIGFDGNMDTNIAIRTLVHSDHTIRFWAGGGIVNDSVLEDEYQESYDKAGAMLQLLQKMKVTD